MTLNLFIIILWWAGTILGIALVASLVFALVMFLIACGLYVIPYFQSKVDLKSIASEKYENRIYIDEAKYIIADKELQEKVDEKQAYIKELESDIRKVAAEKKSVLAEAEREKKAAEKKSAKK